VTDAADTQPWSSFRSYYDPQGNVLAQIGLNDGGSFWINVYDPDGQNRFARYTDVYDGAGRLVSHTQTNLDGTHTVDANAIQAFMDTLTWYPNPHVVDGATPPTDDRGSPGDLVGMLTAGDPRAGDPFATAFGALQEGLAANNGRGGPSSDLPMLGSDSSDMLAALLAGLRDLFGDAGNGGVGGSDGPLATLLSNGSMPMPAWRSW
jgi:YD repeat-containing protein